MVKLSLYTGFVPNYNNQYYYFYDLTKYKTYLSSVLLTTIETDNYRINVDTIKLKYDGNHDLYIATYICEEVFDTNNALLFTRFYHVINCIYQSGYFIINLKSDLWANYIYKANISRVHVLESNKKIGTGLLPRIESITSNTIDLDHYFNVEKIKNTGNHITPRNYRVYIFAVITQNEGATILSRGTTIDLYAINQSAVNGDISLMIGSIDSYKKYYTRSNGSQFEPEVLDNVSFSATATKLWCFNISNMTLVGKAGETITQSGGWVKQYTSKVSFHCKSSEQESFDASRLARYSFSYDLDMSSYLDISLHNKLFIGGLRKYIELPRITTTPKVKLIANVSEDNFNVQLYICNSQYDITDLYEMLITNNNSSDNNLDYMKKCLSIMSSYNSLLTSKDLTGGVISFYSDILNLPQRYDDKVSGQSGYNQNFDDNGFYSVPAIDDGMLYLLYAPSVNDEGKVNTYKGATYNKYIYLYDLFNADFIDNDTSFNTYVKANILVDQVPTEASDYIKACFASGIYLEYVD